MTERSEETESLPEETANVGEIQQTEEYYCYRESWGCSTNLQLWSLYVAYKQWQELERFMAENESERSIESRIREQCVVIISLLGLSVSQLLGQNAPDQNNRVPPPRILLPKVLDRLSVEKRRRDELEEEFRIFIEDYDACRHFGAIKHDIVTAIDMKKTEKYVDLCLSIFNAICGEALTEYEGIKGVLDELNNGKDYAPQEVWP